MDLSALTLEQNLYFLHKALHDHLLATIQERKTKKPLTVKIHLPNHHSPFFLTKKILIKYIDNAINSIVSSTINKINGVGDKQQTEILKSALYKIYDLVILKKKALIYNEIYDKIDSLSDNIKQQLFSSNDMWHLIIYTNIFRNNIHKPPLFYPTKYTRNKIKTTLVHFNYFNNLFLSYFKIFSVTHYFEKTVDKQLIKKILKQQKRSFLKEILKKHANFDRSIIYTIKKICDIRSKSKIRDKKTYLKNVINNLTLKKIQKIIKQESVTLEKNTFFTQTLLFPTKSIQIFKNSSQSKLLLFIINNNYNQTIAKAEWEKSFKKIPVMETMIKKHVITDEYDLSVDKQPEEILSRLKKYLSGNFKEIDEIKQIPDYQI